MANIQISVSGNAASASAGGEVTDTEILKKIDDVIQHLKAKSFQPPPLPQETPESNI